MLESTPDTFRGYDTTSVDTRVVALFDADRQEIPALAAGAKGFAAFEATPLLPGGRRTGVRRGHDRVGRRRPCRCYRRGAGGRIGPVSMPWKVSAGSVATGTAITARVAAAVRDATRRNHTAHSPPARGTPAGARAACEAGGVAGSAGPPALRFRAPCRAHVQPSSARSSAW
jgi:alanyl-tRNA synthetase